TLPSTYLRPAPLPDADQSRASSSMARTAAHSLGKAVITPNCGALGGIVRSEGLESRLVDLDSSIPARRSRGHSLMRPAVSLRMARHHRNMVRWPFDATLRSGETMNQSEAGALIAALRDCKGGQVGPLEPAVVGGLHPW